MTHEQMIETLLSEMPYNELMRKLSADAFSCADGVTDEFKPMWIATAKQLQYIAELHEIV